MKLLNVIFLFIKGNVTKSLIIALVALAAYAFIVTKSRNNIKNDRNRLSSNQEVLFNKIRKYKTSDSLSAASVGVLNLKIKDLDNANNDLNYELSNIKDVVKSLNIRIKDLVSVSQTGTQTNYDVKTIIKDSIIYRDGAPVVLKCIDFSNGWLTANGCSENGIFNGTIQSIDTLTTVVHRVRHKFLFIRWGTKAVLQDVTSKNPYSEISYTKYLNFAK